MHVIRKYSSCCVFTTLQHLLLNFFIYCTKLQFYYLIHMKSNIPYKFLIAASVVLSLTFCSLQSKHQSVPTLTQEQQHKIIQETQCLHEALWFESRSEPLEGKVAVLEVIHNRTLHKDYPDSYCDVIQQSRQFSYRNHLRTGQFMLIKMPVNALERKVATDVSTLAFNAASGRLKPSLPPSVLWYHVASMKKKPQWAIVNKFCKDHNPVGIILRNCSSKQKNPRLYVTIGSHSFYRS